MYAVIGRVTIHPGHEEETLAMIIGGGVTMVQGMVGSAGGYWGRAVDAGNLIQHSFWLFDTEQHVRAVEAMFNMLRSMPEAPATFISCDVCEVAGQA